MELSRIVRSCNILFTSAVIATLLSLGQSVYAAETDPPEMIDEKTGDKGSCMDRSPSISWEVTDFIMWGTSADDEAEPPIAATKGFVFNITNTAIDYTTPCIITVEPPPEDVEEGNCGDIAASWDDEAGNLTVAQTWTCEQENWPVLAQFAAEGSQILEFDCPTDSEDEAGDGLGALLPFLEPFCRVPDFVIKPSTITGIA